MPAAAPTIAPPHTVRESGGGRALARDMRLALLLGNEMRHRALARVFGTSREQANLITFLAALTLMQAASDRWRRMVSGPHAPSLGDDVLATASLRELLSGVAGLPSNESSQLGTLLALVFLGGLGGPSIARSVRGVRAGSARLDRGFRHRYGYLVDPGHLRRRRYEAQERLRALARQSAGVSS
jgi:hypothetical protein